MRDGGCGMRGKDCVMKGQNMKRWTKRNKLTVRSRIRSTFLPEAHQNRSLTGKLKLFLPQKSSSE